MRAILQVIPVDLSDEGGDPSASVDPDVNKAGEEEGARQPVTPPRGFSLPEERAGRPPANVPSPFRSRTVH